MLRIIEVVALIVGALIIGQSLAQRGLGSPRQAAAQLRRGLWGLLLYFVYIVVGFVAFSLLLEGGWAGTALQAAGVLLIMAAYGAFGTLGLLVYVRSK